MTEIWKPVPIDGFGELYKISNLGRVMSFNMHAKKEERFLTPSLNKQRGYYYVCVHNKGKRRNLILSRLVAKLFVHNEDVLNKTHVDHIDFDKANNCAENLQWLSAKENTHKKIRANRNTPTRGELSGMAKLKDRDVQEMRLMWRNGKSQKQIQEKFKVAKCTISLIVNHKRWSHIK